MNILILILATWRISNLLIHESGPYSILDVFRAAIGIYYGLDNKMYAENTFAELFICLWCLSFWVGLIFAIFYYFFPLPTIYILLPFALSAGAILIGEVINKCED